MTSRQTKSTRIATKDLAQMVWAFARMRRVVGPELLDEISAFSLSHLHTASPYDISNLLWGIAKIVALPSQVLPSSAGVALHFASPRYVLVGVAGGWRMYLLSRDNPSYCLQACSLATRSSSYCSPFTSLHLTSLLTF